MTPTPHIVNDPKAVDLIVKNMQGKLSAYLTWLEAAFGRAYRMKDLGQEGNSGVVNLYNGSEYFPEEYKGDNEYQRVTPNDKYKSMCYFLVGDVQFDEYHQNKFNYITREVRIVFWTDLDEINATKNSNYRFTEELISEVDFVCAKRFSGIGGQFEVNRISSDFEEVYKGFDLDEAGEQPLKSPYAGFVVIGTLTYKHDCTVNLPPIPPTPCPGVDVYNTDKSFDVLVSAGGELLLVDTPVTVKSSDGTTLANKDVLSITGGNITLNFLDQNGDPINVDSVTGDNVTLNTHWVRNPDWLTMPEINIGDERFVGLYAVFENDVDDNTITIDVGAGVSIDYGDGTVITSVAGTNTHLYNYATISSPILQTIQGHNYKMVIVDIDLTGVTDVILNQGLTDRPRRITGWLDIIAAGSTINRILLALSSSAYPAFIERFYVKEMNLTSSSDVGQVQMCSNLKIYEYPLLNSTTTGFNSLFTYATNSGVRTNSGQPISINNTNSIDARTFCRYSGVDVLGDLNIPNALFNNAFQDSSIREVGDLTLTNVTDIQQIFLRTGVYKVGTITVGISLTNIFRAFLATNLESIVFSGDMSGVTNTSQAFGFCNNLRELILPNITVGFDISDNKISGTYLQALFTSLGTASGAQTITLANFTIGEDTSIATGKGFTIAYA